MNNLRNKLIKRQIPTEYHDKLYLCNKFMSFVNDNQYFSSYKGNIHADNTLRNDETFAFLADLAVGNQNISQ